MSPTVRTQPTPGIMSLITPAIFFLAALSGSYLFSFRARRSRAHGLTRDLMSSSRSRGFDDYDSADEDFAADAQSRNLIYDSGEEDDYLMVFDKPQFRTQFGVGPGAAVRGYPSYGGIYVLHCTAVELDFLNLDRFHIAMRSLDQTDEDTHCGNMRKLGATWWESEDAYRRNFMSPDRYNQPVVYVGWPASGGVWVLRTTHGDASSRGIGRINNTYNMEERCRLIRQLGGSYYEHPEDGVNLVF
ncbi:hypothetical protein F4814DRAFT_208435 [Daldinia grandis]|nr:hypothetical protein F4814DRAFT_208435 [Daldinia grandis]